MKLQTLQKLDFISLRERLSSEAKTAKGRFLLQNLLPHRSFSALQEEIALVREMGLVLAEKGRPPLAELEALAPIVEGAAKGRVLNEEEVDLVRRYLEAAHQVAQFFRGASGPGLRGLLSQLPRPSKLQLKIDRLLEKGVPEVKSEASAGLLKIRKEIRSREEGLKKALQRLLKKYVRMGWLQEELITQRRGRYVFPFKAEAKSRVQGILHDTSASGATIYIEPLEIANLSNEIERLRHEERQEILRLLQIISRDIASEKDLLLQIEDILAQVDVLQAKAVFGQHWQGALPLVKREGTLRLLNAVHPLFLLSGRRAVPNDFVFPSDRPVVVISGPNLGGKTVALKTVGLLILMAQSAIPIPASPDSETPFFESVLVDIGDEQDLSQDESTFSAHVRNLKEILEAAGPGRLFLLDEIGRGTDPAEGAALAMAVLEKLAASGARVLATTHYEALKGFSFAREDVLPLSVSFDEETGEPTYRLAYGVAGLSRGLVLAARLGLPKEIISRAQEYLGRDEEHFKAVLQSLQQTLKHLEAERSFLKEEKARLEREKKVLTAERHRLEEEVHHLKKDLEERFRKRIFELDREFKHFLAEIKAQRLGEKKALRRFEHFLKEKVSQDAPSSDFGLEPRPGARVRLKGLGQEGRLLKVKGSLALVQIGPFRVEVNLKDLMVLPDEGRPGSKVSFQVKAQTDVPQVVNLIGLQVDEALNKLEKILDRAFLSGKTRLTVIHGLGTGRLMRAVRGFLSDHQQVARIRAGESFEGGEAVTIVELATEEVTGGP